MFLCETPDLISDCIYDLRAVSSKFVERVTCFHSLISASSSRSFSVTNFRASGPRRLQTVSGIVYENIDGADLVLALKENIPDATPIVFISGIYRDKQFAQETVRKTGALDYFLKPFNNDALVEIIE